MKMLLSLPANEVIAKLEGGLRYGRVTRSELFFPLHWLVYVYICIKLRKYLLHRKTVEILPFSMDNDIC